MNGLGSPSTSTMPRHATRSPPSLGSGHLDGQDTPHSSDIPESPDGDIEVDYNPTSCLSDLDADDNVVHRRERTPRRHSNTGSLSSRPSDTGRPATTHQRSTPPASASSSTSSSSSSRSSSSSSTSSKDAPPTSGRSSSQSSQLPLVPSTPPPPAPRSGTRFGTRLPPPEVE